MATVVPKASKEPKVNYFGTELACLKIFGFSLTGNESTPYRVYAYLYYLATFVYLLLDIYEVTKHDDINVIAEILIYIAALSIALSKGFVIHLNRARIGELINKFQTKPFLPDPERGGDQEAKIIGECVWLTRIQTSVYYFVSVLALGGNIIYALFRRISSSDYHDWQLTYGPLTALNVTYSPNYEISWFYQNISLFFCSATFISTDLLLAAILAHISYQFKLLQNYLRGLVKTSYNDMVLVKTTTSVSSGSSKNANPDPDYSTIPWAILKKHLTKAVNYHLAIIGIADEVETVFSDLLLLTFLGTLGLLCCTVYTASIATSNTQLGRHLCEMTNSCLQVLTVCFWGEQVCHESSLVGKAAYESNFVGTDLRFQKSLTFIIRRSQNLIKLTAGKFSVISLATFTWILRTSYSAFMVLRGANANKI